ncbi:MAG: hypothetical protein V7752_06240 [Halopseudomonas sp.]
MGQQQSWSFEAQHHQISHVSGLCLEIEGEIRNPDGIVPIHIPDNMDSVDLVALIRQGTNYCRALATKPVVL